MIQHGNGFTMIELYKTPTHLRNFYYRKLLDLKKKEAEDVKNNSIKSPIKPGKVRIK